jgi:DNA-binding GntR family transcriptional regulator
MTDMLVSLWTRMRIESEQLLKKPISQATTLSGEAYAVIRERILRGEVAVGQVISRRKLAVELGMSLLPVNEAFLRLEFEGLLESRPRAGTRVRIPSREDVEGHYIVREALEVQAARLYAKLSTAEERAAMLRLATRLDAMSAAPETNRAVYLSLHERLHHQIAEYGRCRSLCDALEKTCALSSIWLCIGRPVPDGHNTPHRHRDLIEALGQGDPDTAAVAMEEHIATSRDSILERLEPYFRLGDTSGQAFVRSARRQQVVQ